MAQLGRRGLRIEDDDGPAKYQKQTLDAGRKRSNFEKDMDDLLFGGGMKPAVRRQPKQEVPINKQSEPAKTIQPVQSSSPRNQPVQPTQPRIPQIVQPSTPRNQVSTRAEQRSDSRPKVGQKSQQKPSKVEQKKSVIPTKNNINSIKSIGLISKVDTNQDTKPAIKKIEQSIIIEQPSIQQPKYHQQPKTGPEQVVEVGKIYFNRPGYIRKGKKIAEEFNFVNENSNNHVAIDVVRPLECDRNKVKNQNQLNFYDYEFPPTSYSLGYTLKSTPSEWKRHNEIVKTSIFGKYIDPNDINPGKFSSGQFLSTLSALAENQVNIKRLIEDQKVNSNGFYYIRLNINGVWRYIAVDNKLPASNGQALGAQSFNDTESQLWSALIEKAYAKVFSGYSTFNRITPRENFLRDLTGAPVRKYLITDPQISNLVRNALNAGQPILAVPKPQILSLGLNPNNSLTVLNCKSTGGLQLRNSFGTTEQRPKLTFNKQGAFQLSSNQTKEFISHIIIAHTNISYSSSTIESKHKTGFYSTFSFKVRNDTHGFLTISQWDERLFPQSSYEYSPIRLIVQKKNSDGSASFVNAGFSTSRNLDVEVNLTEGEYEVFVAGNWKAKQYDYDLTFFGKEKVTFKRQYTSKFPNKIAEALTKLNISTGKSSSVGNSVQYSQYHRESNLILVTVENTSQKEQQLSQDFSKVNWNTLLLLNAKNNEQTYENLTGSQTEDYKHNSNVNRKWSVSVHPHQPFTWIISTSEDYNADNFSKWGFK